MLNGRLIGLKSKNSQFRNTFSTRIGYIHNKNKNAFYPVKNHKCRNEKFNQR